MIIRKTTAILAAIFLVTIISQAEAKLNLANEFCGDKYCGYRHHEQIRTYPKSGRKITHRKPIKHAWKAAHKKIQPKPIKVASLGENPTSEQKPASEHSQGLLQKAESYLGGNPTGWRSVWCARFVAFIAPKVADRLKRMGLNPNWARDYAKLPEAKRIGQVGDLVVLTRGRGGHIGFVKKFLKNGYILIVSGNHGHKVGIGAYPTKRVLAYATL